jgi:ribosomal protein L32
MLTRITKLLFTWINRLLCSHQLVFVRNVHGDEINRLGCRSIWKCRKCGHSHYSNHLYLEGTPRRRVGGLLQYRPPAPEAAGGSEQ